MTIEQLLCPAVIRWESEFRKHLNESNIEMSEDEIDAEFDKWLVENEELINKSVEDNIEHINETIERNKQKVLNKLNEGKFDFGFDDEDFAAEDGGGVLTDVAVDNLHQHLVIDQDRDIGVDVLEGDATIYRDEPLLQRKVILHHGYSLRRTDWLPVAVSIELAINSPVEQAVHLYHTDGGHGCDGAVGHFLQHYLATIAQSQLVTIVCGIHLGDIEVLLHGCSQYGELADLGVQTGHLSL